MTPIKFINKIIDDRRAIFCLATGLYPIPLMLYVIMDFANVNTYIRASVCMALWVIIRCVFRRHVKRMDIEDKAQANDRLEEENFEIAQMLCRCKMYKTHHLKDIIIALAKELQNEKT